MTFNELLRYGTECLKEAGIPDAKTDAGLLFEYLTGMDRHGLLMHGDEELRDKNDPGVDIRAEYISLLERRAGHEPVQYITGVADFMGLRFYVNEDVLIPRFDTEFLVEEMMRDVGDGSSVLDMCTGSGCIILSLMRYKNGIRGTGVDISAAALDVARKNERLIFNTQDTESPMGFGLHNYNPVTWIQSDMFENVTGVFDHIVSNPPYIQSEVISTLMPEVREHEPRTALDGGEDGLGFYRIIAGEATKHLSRSGRLYLETGYDEAENVSALLYENGFRDIKILKDYSGNYRVVTARGAGYR